MKKRLRPSYAGLLLLLLPSVAMAADTLNQVQQALQGKILPWQGIMQQAATGLFYALAAVEFSVLFLNHVLQKRGHEDLFAGIIKKVVTLGFFLTVLNNSGTWIPAIINGLAGGAHALGVTSVSPSGIAQEALQVFLGVALAPLAAANHNISPVLSDLGSFNFTGAFSALGPALAASNPVSLVMELLISAIVGLLAGIGVLVMALEFLMVQVESYLVIALGVVMLAGGGLRWTSKYVGSYFDYAINVGVRLFILTALAFLVTYSIVPIMTTVMENVTNPLQMGFEMIILGAVIALLSRKASSIASSLLSGQSTFSGGELMKESAMVGVGAVVAGAAVAAAPVALAAGMGAGGLGAASAAGSAGGAGSLAGAAGMGEAGAAAGVAAPEAGAMSAGGSGAASGSGNAAHGVPAPAPSAPQAGGAQAAKAADTAKGVEAPNPPDAGSGKDERPATDSQPASQSDAVPAPVNAVPAPEPSAPASSPQKPGVKEVLKSLEDANGRFNKAIDHFGSDDGKVGATKISTEHLRDFD